MIEARNFCFFVQILSYDVYLVDNDVSNVYLTFMSLDFQNDTEFYIVFFLLFLFYKFYFQTFANSLANQCLWCT